MRLMVFNWVVFGLFVVGLVGFLIVRNKLLLALAVIFGVWSLVNVVEHFVRGRLDKKPLRMVKE